ncbi:MAG TPA: DUF2520 domain-containing protein [Flavipsychrobacter sp.]|nr:DUF2520 domain-containing protein [Flavipsychrobacter sp.]
MNYTLIGTGNMAYFLADRFRKAGFVCKGVYGRNATEAQALATMLECIVIEQPGTIPDTHDCCIMAISDHAIKEVSSRLHFENTVVVHTAGSVSLDAVLQPHKAALWPIYSILKNNLPDHRDLPVVCESQDEKAKNSVLQLAHALSDHVREVSWQQRQYMHLIAAIENNFINHLMAIGKQLCTDQHIPFELFLPILNQTFERIHTADPYELQTGAARRNDMKTQQHHLELLQQYPKWQAIYQAISESIKDMYIPTGNKERKD